MIQTRHYSPRTIESYIHGYAYFLSSIENRSSPAGQNQINEFLTSLAVENHVSASTQNQALTVLLFYFRYIKQVEPHNLSDVIHAKHKKRLPVVLTKKEVKRIIERLDGAKDRRVMLPETLIPKLIANIINLRDIHEKDLAEGWGSVQLRAGMTKRSSETTKEFRWQWLFPQKNLWRNKTTGQQGRHHIYESIM